MNEETFTTDFFSQPYSKQIENIRELKETISRSATAIYPVIDNILALLRREYETNSHNDTIYREISQADTRFGIEKYLVGM